MFNVIYLFVLKRGKHSKWLDCIFNNAADVGFNLEHSSYAIAKH